MYVVWDDIAFQDIFYATSTDGGDSFDIPNDSTDNNVSNNGASRNSNVFAVNDTAYIVWVNDNQGNGDVFFNKGSINSGTLSLGTQQDIENDPGKSYDPVIAVSGSKVFVAYQVEGAGILSSVSLDGGSTFSSVNLSNNTGQSTLSQIAASGSKAYVVWQNNAPGNFDVFIRSIEETGPPSITIESTSSTTPKWGIGPVMIRGLVNANGTDTISIDWNDGNITSGLAVNSSSWGPISHLYNSSSTGPRHIVVTLLNEMMVQKASDFVNVNVQKHITNLTVRPIFSVVNATNVTVHGVLRDLDTGVPIENGTITFNGTGSSNLLSSQTLANGSYSSTALSPNSVGESWIVQAHFAGDSAYNGSNSSVEAYDTVAPSTTEFNVPAGSPSGPIALTGFNASIVFDDVLNDGSVFVSTCSSPASPRYDVLSHDRCLRISPHVELGLNSAAHITMSYNGSAIPNGHSPSEVDLFHQGLSGIVDITESRSIGSGTITGRTTSFSNFMVGVALHSAPPIGAVRQQVFVGDNDLLFDFTATKTISFDESAYSIGSSVALSVIDTSENLDGSSRETIHARVNSTSNPTGINVNLLETGVNTRIFSGTFTLTSDTSSSAGSKLHVSEGDHIIASYQEHTRAPFRAIIRGVSEAGMAEVLNYTFSVGSLTPFAQVSDGYELRLIDATRANNANITIIMSYVNEPSLSHSEELQLAMLRMDSSSNCKEANIPGNGVDTTRKTVSANTTALGRYVIGFAGENPPGQCPAFGGGGTSGLPRPGTGVVLDAIASVTRTIHPHGGGGSSSQGAAPDRSILLLGKNIGTTLKVGSQTIDIAFNSLLSNGQIQVSPADSSIIANTFEQVTSKQGMIHLGGSPYSTIGTIFDIHTTASFEGSVKVTISYNESMVTDESNVRLLHYDEVLHQWEDITTAIDTTNNTVSGTLHSLSPIVAAVVHDGTFAKPYIAINPLNKIVTDGSSIAANANPREQMPIPVNIRNLQQTNQNYIAIVQVTYQDGVVYSISWQTGTIAGGQSTKISSNWNAEEPGIYTIKIFVWDNTDNPSALSTILTKQVRIS